MTKANQPNPRIEILRRDVDQQILKPFRSHGWTAEITREHDHHSSLELTASKANRTVHIAVLYGSATANAHYKDLESRVEHMFFHGQPYQVESFTQGVKIPVEPLGDFFPLLVSLNKEVTPDRSPAVKQSAKLAVRRITDENPREAVLTRLQQFTSLNLAKKLIERRALHEQVSLTTEQITSKAEGIAYSMRSALDYLHFSPAERLNKRILGLYYGTMSFAFSEMLASPKGPMDLDEVQGMTKQGHGLYTLSGGNDGFADVHVGVLATGFLPNWLAFLGQDSSNFPKTKPKSRSDLEKIPSDMSCTLRQLFSSMPELDDLFAEVFSSSPSWIVPVYDSFSNNLPSINGTHKKASSTYALFIDRSGLISKERLESAGWPIAEVEPVEGAAKDGEVGNTFRARVDHAGHELWWNVMPTHRSPFGHSTTLLFPTIGGMREYRTIAAATLYALSIMVRYMPSAWRRIEGGDEDQYLALVQASLSAWERILPEQFLQSIASETVVTSQPGW